MKPKTRLYSINYHDATYQHGNINRCWGNSLAHSVKAYNIIDAIKKFQKKCGKDKLIYSIDAYHPTTELEYDATQAFLKVEGFIT